MVVGCVWLDPGLEEQLECSLVLLGSEVRGGPAAVAGQILTPRLRRDAASAVAAHRGPVGGNGCFILGSGACGAEGPGG